MSEHRTVDDVDEFEPELLADERAAQQLGWRFLTVELDAGRGHGAADLDELRDAVLAALIDVAGHCATGWSGAPFAQNGPLRLVLGLRSDDHVDAVERVAWLEEEIAALDGSGSWTIEPGIL